MHYHFITLADFVTRIARGQFAEYARVHGNYYGTLVADLEDLLSTGQDVVFDLDVQGVSQLKQKFPQAVTVFIFPPSSEVLRQRIIDRNRGETEAEISVRLGNATKEMEQAKNFDRFIVNGDLSVAVAEFLSMLNELK